MALLAAAVASGKQDCIWKYMPLLANLQSSFHPRLYPTSVASPDHMRQCGQKRRAEGPPPEAAVAPSAAAGAAAPIYVTPAPVWGPPAAAAAPVPMEGAEAAAVGEAPPATPRPLQVPVCLHQLPSARFCPWDPTIARS